MVGERSSTRTLAVLTYSRGLLCGNSQRTTEPGFQVAVPAARHGKQQGPCVT